MEDEEKRVLTPEEKKEIRLHNKKELIKEFKQEKAFHIINTLIATCIFLVVFYPLYYIVISSFSSGAAVASGRVILWPVEFTLDGYKEVGKYQLLVTGFTNTVIYTVIGTMINVFMTILAAYPLSRKELYGRNKITLFFAFTMWFNGGMIPTYLLFKDLGLIDNRLVMIIPGALSIWNMVITRTYLQKSIPEELIESATLDGCTDISYLLRIALPLAKPIIAVITLYYAVGHWNQFFNAMIYLSTPDKYPLQLVLRDILLAGSNAMQSSGGSMTTDELLYFENVQQLLKYSVIVVSAVPMLSIYPLVQKHFVKGIMVGALKG